MLTITGLASCQSACSASTGNFAPFFCSRARICGELDCLGRRMRAHERRNRHNCCQPWDRGSGPPLENLAYARNCADDSRARHSNPSDTDLFEPPDPPDLAECGKCIE